MGVALIGVRAVAVASPALASAFPGQNGKLVYAVSSPVNSTAYLATVNPDGSGQTQIGTPWSSSHGLAQPARVSPDGKKIVWPKYPWTQIWTANIDGSGESAVSISGLPAANATLTYPTFTADGSRIAFDVGTDYPPKDYGIWEVSVSGGKAIQLDDGNDISPTFSPDGTKLAFVQSGTLEVAGADGTNPHGIANTYTGDPEFSPDGKTIAFAGDGGISTVPAAGGPQTQLTNTPGDTSPAYSPDGTEIAFIRSVPGPMGIPVFEIDVMSLSGGAATPVISVSAGTGTVLAAVDWQCTSCTARPLPAQQSVGAAVASSLSVTASIKSILKQGGYTASVSLPVPGKLTIAWRSSGSGTHSSRSIVVASGSKTFSHAGTAKLKIRLTSAGRALLKRSKHIKLTAVGSFRPTNGKTVTKRRTITLSR